MNIYLIRHTKVAVAAGICYGQSDVAVASSFDVEKEQVTATIANIKFDKVYSSPLKRCKVLAEHLFSDKSIVFDERLKELNFGNWELTAWDTIYAQDQGKVWMDNYQTLPTLNGESYPEMVARILAFFEELKSLNNENVAIVTHAGVIRIFKSLIEKHSIDELFKSFQPEYGSVSEFRV